MESLYSYKVFGPFGGEGEIHWHFGEINGIEAFYNERCIKSITFQVDGGTSNNVDPGGNDGNKHFKVKLEDRERITHFRGYFRKIRVGGSEERIVIASLTFETNKNGVLGTIGKERGEPFSVPSVAGRIIEFFGRKTRGSGRPTSIGARVKLPSEDSHRVGLFGNSRNSKKESEWDDENGHTTVLGIRVALDSTGNKSVRWIAFLYDGKNGEWSTYGSNAHAQPYEEFKIYDSDEHLSSISGSFTPDDGITSLTFLTNKKRTKTIGVANGTHFSSPLTGGKIVGFYGWSDEHLQGIGAYFKPTRYLNRVKSIGPFGGVHVWDDGIHKGVKKIYLSIGDDIRYIRFVYDVDGKECREVTHPKGVSPPPLDLSHWSVVSLEYPKEYLTSISGYTRDDGSIQALTFYTNKKHYIHQSDDCGHREKRNYFWYPSTGADKIVGFHGTWGKTLNSVGAYLKPISRPPSPKKDDPIEDASGGDLWDDKKHFHVIGYRVTDSIDNKRIESITFWYDDNGSTFKGDRRGGGNAGKWIKLNFPKERLISLTGYWRKEGDGTTIIHNLQLRTTSQTRKVLTYAERKGPELIGSKSFKIPIEPDESRRISGFFGRANTCLNSIGAYVGHY